MTEPIDRQFPVELEVESVLNTFRMLEKAGTLDAFIQNCREKNFVLLASAELVATGKSALRAIPGLQYTGPDCPACPYPRI